MIVTELRSKPYDGSWDASRPPAHLTLVALVMFVLAVISHQAVMAAEPLGVVTSSHQYIELTSTSTGGAHHIDLCKSTHDGSTCPCCTTDACFVGCAPVVISLFFQIPTPEQTETRFWVPAASPLEMPFRPPALI